MSNSKNEYDVNDIIIIPSNNYEISYHIRFDDKKREVIYKTKKKLSGILQKYKFKKITKDATSPGYFEFVYDIKYINYKHNVTTIATNLFKLIIFLHNLMVKYIEKKTKTKKKGII